MTMFCCCWWWLIGVFLLFRLRETTYEGTGRTEEEHERRFSFVSAAVILIFITQAMGWNCEIMLFFFSLPFNVFLLLLLRRLLASLLHGEFSQIFRFSLTGKTLLATQLRLDYTFYIKRLLIFYSFNAFLSL